MVQDSSPCCLPKYTRFMARVGVVAIQGDFQKHAEALLRLQDPNIEVLEVRSPEDLEAIDRLIIPGGESTTVGLLMERYGLGPAIQRRATAGMPVWGTCMGMIMMATAVEGREGQYTLGLLDIGVQRNAFGAQVHSFEDEVQVEGLDRPVTGVFIRAPVVSRLGFGVRAIASYNGRVVGVRQEKLVGTSFHPELTDDSRLHAWFASL
jgi:pyridoxal 5'-phosphate synthase pdxT subunit